MAYTNAQPGREGRSTRYVEAYLRRQDGREISAVVVNISLRGCRLRAEEELLPGERIWVGVPRLGSIAANVRWVEQGLAGVEFIPQSDVWETLPACSRAS